MILNKLAAEYENLAAQGKVGRPGWTTARVSYALELDLEGRLISVLSLLETEVTENKGKTKTVTIPRTLAVPEQVKRSSGIAANFLCDNQMYFLGLGKAKKDADDKQAKNATRVADCFKAAGKLHRDLLGAVPTPAAVAICRFFDTWDPSQAETHPAVRPFLDSLKAGGNLVFLVNGEFAGDNPAIRAAWQRSYDHSEDDPQMICLDTGKMAPVAVLHPNIQGVRGAKSTGASLVSFNAPAYESYGRSEAQGFNAPVSKYTAFAYGEALKYLLKDSQRVRVIGDTTVVCWADSGSPVYQDLFCQSLDDGDVMSVLNKLAKGLPVDLNGVPLSPEEPFYLLGLAPNAARISVRFFLQGSFGSFARNIDAHYQRMELGGSPGMEGKRSVWDLLQETVNQKSKNRSPKPQLAGDLLKAILGDTRYPATLYHGVQLRIQAERVINWRRAAIIQAFLLKNEKITKEILQMNEDGKMATIPGKLGQLFSLFEQTQLYSIRGMDYRKKVERTIVDRYFTSASTTPAMVFPLLIDLNKKHLSKISKKPELWGAAAALEKQITELLGEIAAVQGGLPARLDLAERGQFQLGYYFEKEKRFSSAKHDDKNEQED